MDTKRIPGKLYKVTRAPSCAFPCRGVLKSKFLVAKYWEMVEAETIFMLIDNAGFMFGSSAYATALIEDQVWILDFGWEVKVIQCLT